MPFLSTFSFSPFGTRVTRHVVLNTSLWPLHSCVCISPSVLGEMVSASLAKLPAWILNISSIPESPLGCPLWSFCSCSLITGMLSFTTLKRVVAPPQPCLVISALVILCPHSTPFSLRQGLTSCWGDRHGTPH